MTSPPWSPAPERRQRAGFWLFAGHLWTLFGIAGSNVLLGLGLLTAPWTTARPAPWRRFAPLLLPLATYVLLLGVTILLSYDPRVSLRSASDVFNLATLPLALLLVRREQDLRRIAGGLVLVAGLLAVSGLVQYVLGANNLDQRIRGTLSHYMTFAGVLLLADCLLLAFMSCAAGWRRWWSWLLLVVINLALFQSYTRGAWVALAVVLAVLALVRAPRWLLAALPATVLLLLLAPRPLVHRITSIFDLADPSNYDRVCMAYAGAHMVAERPLFGIGPEMVPHRYAIYRHPTAQRYWVPHLHSTYLNLAAERGLTSLAVLLWLWWVAAGTALRRLRAEGGLAGPRADLYLGMLLALLAFAVAGLFEDNWADTEVQRIVLFLLALPFCLPEPETSA